MSSSPFVSLFEREDVADEKGLNTKAGFDVKVADEISKITGHKFITAPNKVCLLF
jgi:fumarate hydratase class II